MPACLSLHFYRAVIMTLGTEKPRLQGRSSLCFWAHHGALRTALCYTPADVLSRFHFITVVQSGGLSVNSISLSWNWSSPKLPVCPCINVNITLLLLSIMTPPLPPQPAGGVGGKTTPLMASSFKSNLPIYSQLSNRICQTVITLVSSLKSMHVHPIFSLLALLL